MKISIIIFSLLLCISLSASWVSLSNTSFETDQPLVSCIDDNSATSILEFHLDGYEIQELNRNGEIFHKISYPNESSLQKQGYPELPIVSRLIAIPQMGEVSVEIVYTDYDIVNNLNIYPVQDNELISDYENTTFRIDKNFYNSNSQYPEKPVLVGNPAIFRDFRVVNVSFQPFQYNPSTRELKLFKNIKVNVTTSGYDGENQMTSSKKLSRSFEPLYRSQLLNYDQIVSRDAEYQQPSYLFIYKSGTSALENLEPLLDWKREKGFQVTAAGTSETGTSNSSIKNYIQDAYDNWENPPEFICLVGDATGSFAVPTWSDPWSGYNGEGDHPYSQLEGDDILADAMLGRISFETTMQQMTIVNKILTYESQPYVEDPNWFNHMTLVGDPSYSGQSCVDTNMYIKSIMQQYSDDFTYAEEYQSNFENHIAYNINLGTTFFNYRGYLGMSGWQTSNVNSLNNGSKLTVAIILTCGTGSFASETSMSEIFLRAGTPSVPKGAIGSVGTATWGTHTTFNNSCSAGIFDGFFVDRMYYLGGALLSGKMNLYTSYPDNPGNKVNIFSFWNNLMGDPGLEAWTGTPQPLTVTYVNEVNNSSNFLAVNVLDDQSTALENVWVTVTDQDSEIISTSYTDADGNVILPLDTTDTDMIKLTVTHHNFIPYQSEITLGNPDIFCQIFSYNLDDDNSGSSTGNNNNIANPGETIEIPVVLTNTGSSVALNVTASISTTSSYVTISDADENFGNIAAGTSENGDDDFDIYISPATPNGETIVLEMTISSDTDTWTDYIVLQVLAGYLNQTAVTVNDGDNFQLDPGETADIYFTLENIGNIPLYGVTALLSTESNFIDIINPAGTFGDVAIGESFDNSSAPFEVSAISYIINGLLIPVTLELTSTDGFTQTIDTNLQVGTVTVNDPLGPDAYGYVCYDDGDTGYIDVPEYNWIEINEIGTDLNFYDNGNMGVVTTIPLPIYFKFYGENYSNISICSNGWLSPGTSLNRDYMNWPIPGPMGPQPMIAPFWDDLETGSGNVYYYYNPSQHYFVVEWDDMQNEGNSSYSETFQVILYDAMYYPSTTGDSPIKFQYKVFNNVDQGSSSGVPHGQYSTIGIEDHTSTCGLQYSYDNEYPVAAQVLQDNSAIFFTGPPIPLELPYLLLFNVEIDDINNQLDYAETTDLYITLNNIGQNAAEEVIVTISCDDPYLTITQGVINYGTIPGESTLINPEPFIISASADLPDGHVIEFTLVAVSGENSWERFFSIIGHAPEVSIHYPLVVNDDNNNGILDAGENADINIFLHNSGSTGLLDVELLFSCLDPLITLNSNQAALAQIAPGETVSVIFPVTVSNDVDEGHTFDFILNINGLNDYSVTDGFTLIVGLAVENFESGDFTLYPWTFVNQDIWFISESDAYEGNYCAEASNLNYGNSIMEVELTILEAGNISFWCKTETSQNLNRLRFYIDNALMGNWTGSYDWANQEFPVTTGTHTFKWEYGSDGNYNDQVWVDYIVFPFNDFGASGTISGTVTLSGAGDVEDVVISIANLEINPDADGNYSFNLPLGNYEISAILIGYETYLADVLIPAYDILFHDFTMIGIDPPENLQLTLTGNVVDLTWDSPLPLLDSSSSNSSQRGSSSSNATTFNTSSKETNIHNSRNLLYYKVYRNEDDGEFEYIFATTTTHFNEELTEPHFYGYAVSGMYSNSAESYLSDPVYVDFSDGSNPVVPAITELQGNFPNPFNPNTEIKFSLAKDTKVILEIFNIKGQKICTLVHENLSAGNHITTWNGKSDDGQPSGSGVYFYRFRTDNVDQLRKMILLK